MANNEIILVADSVWFYSQNDEAAFFEWLDKIPCITRYNGEGTKLNIFINANMLNELTLRDLLAVFYRYKIDMKQLRVFDTGVFSEWFRDKKNYWFSAIFE